MKDVKQN